VDHTVSAPELVRHWRTATIVATAIAVVELVLLIVGGVVLLGKTVAPHARAAAERHAKAAKRTPAAAASGPSRPAKARQPARVLPRLSRAQTSVIVLNGNGVQGAAGAEASLVRARGYRVRKVANAPHTGYAKSIVMYRPGYAGEARRFGRDLNLGLVTPLDGMTPRQLHGAQIVLILGASR
jgi:LytR cell envelope-related transcriptional attenuator